LSCPALTKRADTSGLTNAQDWISACQAAATWPDSNPVGFFSAYLETAMIGDGATFATNEGCLSMPNVRGDLERFENVGVRYLDRDGEVHEETRRGLTAGTFQHEVDHLDGILFVDRMTDMSSLSTWEEFERHGKADFVARIEALVARVGS